MGRADDDDSDHLHLADAPAVALSSRLQHRRLRGARHRRRWLRPARTAPPLVTIHRNARPMIHQLKKLARRLGLRPYLRRAETVRQHIVAYALPSRNPYPHRLVMIA